MLAFSALGLLPRPLKKPPPPPPPDPNADEPPNGDASALDVLTEANGDVVAADVWPNMDPEEVFPKSGCPAAEPPKILPGVEDAPNVPVLWAPPPKRVFCGGAVPPNTNPGVLCPNTVLAVLAAAVVAGVREGAEEAAGEVKAELEVDRLVKAEVEVVAEALKIPAGENGTPVVVLVGWVEKRDGVAEVAGLADSEPPPGVKARLKEEASPAGGEEKSPVVRAGGEEEAGMEVEAAVVVVEVELVEDDPESSLPNRVLVVLALLATAAVAAAAPNILGVVALVWAGLPKMLPLVDADPKMLPELVEVVPNMLPVGALVVVPNKFPGVLVVPKKLGAVVLTPKIVPLVAAVEVAVDAPKMLSEVDEVAVPNKPGVAAAAVAAVLESDTVVVVPKMVALAADVPEFPNMVAGAVVGLLLLTVLVIVEVVLIVVTEVAAGAAVVVAPKILPLVDPDVPKRLPLLVDAVPNMLPDPAVDEPPKMLAEDVAEVPNTAPPLEALVSPKMLPDDPDGAVPKLLKVLPVVVAVDVFPKRLPEVTVMVNVFVVAVSVPKGLLLEDATFLAPKRIPEAVTGALKTLPVAAVPVADAKKPPEAVVDVTNRAPDEGAPVVALVVVMEVDVDDDPRRPDSTEVLFAKKLALEEDTPLKMLLLPPPKKLPELAENRLGWEVELGGGREASLLTAVSPVLSVSCSELSGKLEPSGKLGVSQVLTLSPMTVAFEAVSESVEDEDDVDSVSATEAR